MKIYLTLVLKRLQSSNRCKYFNAIDACETKGVGHRFTSIHGLPDQPITTPAGITQAKSTNVNITNQFFNSFGIIPINKSGLLFSQGIRVLVLLAETPQIVVFPNSRPILLLNRLRNRGIWLRLN